MHFRDAETMIAGKMPDLRAFPMCLSVNKAFLCCTYVKLEEGKFQFLTPKNEISFYMTNDLNFLAQQGNFNSHLRRSGFANSSFVTRGNHGEKSNP